MDRVKVGVRIRPLIGLEVNNGAANAVQAKNNSHGQTVAQTVVVNVPARKNTYDYDWVFGPNASQQSIYEQVRKDFTYKTLAFILRKHLQDDFIL